tara:strand:+ start:725 stop:1138 length:414 start_codon:yes stop_codon:yes gene_type:complete
LIEELKYIKNDKSDYSKFGITVGIILIIISGILFWKTKESFQLFLIIGIVLNLLGAIAPILLKPMYWIWMIFAVIMGWFMTNIILILLYYTMLTPIGLISRLFGKRFLDLQWNREDKSYWKYRYQNLMDKARYKKQF